MTITELTQKAYNTAKDKGFHEAPMNIPEKLMLIVSELGEAMEADRTGKRFKTESDYLTYLQSLENDKFPEVFKDLQKDTFEDEIADVFIRLFDLCGALDIDIEKHIQLKMRYNETRQRKHGKNY